MSLASRVWEKSLKDLENSLRHLDREFNLMSRALDVIVEFDRSVFRSIFQADFNLDSLLEEMLKELRDLAQADYAQILLRRGSVLYIAHSTHAEDKGKSFPIDQCVCGLTIEKGTISSGDVQRDFGERYQWVLGRDDPNQKRMISEVAVPIYAPPLNGGDAKESIVAGVINIESPSRDAFSDSSRIKLVEAFSVQAGSALNNARVHAGLALTLRLTEDAQAPGRQPADILRNTLEQLSVLFQEGVVIQFLVYDESSRSLTIRSSTVKDTEGVSVLVEDSFSGLVIKENRPVCSNDVHRDHPGLFKDTVGDTVKDDGLRPTQSELAVPIRDDRNQVIGVLNVESPEKDAFSKYDEYLLTIIASNARVWARIYKSKSVLALEKLATVGNVAGHMLHTLRNGLLPLDLIADEVEKIAGGCDPSAREKLAAQVKWLRSITPSIGDSFDKLQDMYARDRIPEGGVNVNEVARQVAKEIISRGDIRLTWELEEGMPNLRISGSIYYVFWNLLSNAQRAISEGQAGEITVGTRTVYGEYTKQLEAYELYVRDTGRGMTDEQREQSLQLEYTSRDGRRVGYGLWWVDTFVQRWEGKMEIESAVGAGTNVNIWLPLTPEGVAAPLMEEDQQ